MIVGTFIVAVDLGSYYLFLHFFHPSISKALSFTCGAAVGYFFHKYWTFEQKRWSYSEVVRYVVINFFGLVINLPLHKSFLNIFPEAFFGAWAFATVLTGILSFISFKWWAFK